MTSNRLRCSGACVKHRSFQFKLAAIKGHHFVHVGDAELKNRCAIILPDIDRFFAFLCDERANQVRRLAQHEQRQVIDRFQIAPVAIKPDDKIDDRSFVVRQWIWHESHFHAGGWLAFRRWGRGLADVFELELTDEITVAAIFSSGQVFVIVIFAVPLRHQRIRADCELVQFGLLMQNAYKRSIPIVNAEADRAFQRRRKEADAHTSRRR